MYFVGEKIRIKGELGQTFLATINGGLVSITIGPETDTGIITKIIPGPRPGTEYSYMIKFMSFQYPVEVDEDYITKFKDCNDKC
ncbi:MAG TPA: hypothetical protein VIY47_15920 [Ignavibacteriaceae bacterium]